MCHFWTSDNQLLDDVYHPKKKLAKTSLTSAVNVATVPVCLLLVVVSITRVVTMRSAVKKHGESSFIRTIVSLCALHQE